MNLFHELVQELLEEGHLSIDNIEKFHEQYPGKQKMTVTRLAGLETLNRFLKKQQLTGAETKAFANQTEVLKYSYKLFKDRMDKNLLLQHDAQDA